MNRANINIALRFDDPSPTSDHALEREIFSILGELGITATVAAVPFGIGAYGLVPLTSDNVPHLVAAHTNGLIEVAQHGYAHKHLSTTPKGSPSEFWGVPADEQHRCVDEGHEQLTRTFGQPICGFIPPWNTYDDTTTRQLADRGYTYLSGSLATPPSAETPLCLIPRTCDVHQLRHAYAEACLYPFLTTTIVVIMHHYDFLECTDKPGKLSLQAFRETLSWIKQKPKVHFITLGRLAESLGVAGNHATLRRHLKKERLHWRLQRWLPKTLLMTSVLWLYFNPLIRIRARKQ